MKLEAYINELESHIEKRDLLNPKVSKVDIAWHIDHSLKVVNGICQVLKDSDPKDYQYKFSLNRAVIFTWGDFPRGVAKSPKIVLPPEKIIKEDLIDQVAKAKELLTEFDQLPDNAHFKHFAFKTLNRKRTMRFLEVHTIHHLKIIRDIYRSSK